MGRMSHHKGLPSIVGGVDVDSTKTVVAPNTTFFGTAEFTLALSRWFGHSHSQLALPVRGSGPRRTLYACQTPARYCSRYVSLAPLGLCASPGWIDHLERSTVERIVHCLAVLRTRRFIWNVRFDHEPLATALASLGLSLERVPTRVVHLDKDYDDVFAGYSATTRNHVRRARALGVKVRDAITSEDVQAYFRVHQRLVQQEQARRGYGYIYPVELLLELLCHGSGRLLIAECDGR
jgi:hypothetical protein